MNRRQLFSMAPAVLAALTLPVSELFAEPPAVEVDHAAIIKGFVAEKVNAGYPDLFLFKNRSGQYIFQTYDPRSGNPTTAESIYLLYGKPDGRDDRLILPPAGNMAVVLGMLVVAVAVDFNTKPITLRSDLNKAFRMLMKEKHEG